MNKALFFPLFVNDYDELQLTTLKRKYGIKGYGVYTFLRTKLQDVDNYEYPIKLIPDLAYLAGIPENEMSDIIYNSSLFVVGNEFFSCPHLDEALNRHNGIIEKKTGQGKKGGQARMSTLTEEQRKELSRMGHEARYGKQKSHVGTNSIDVPAIKSEVNTNSSNVPTNNINACNTGNNLPTNAGNLPSNEIDIEIEREIDIERETDTETNREKESDIESTRFVSQGSKLQPSETLTIDENGYDTLPIESEKKYPVSTAPIVKDPRFFKELRQGFKPTYFKNPIKIESAYRQYSQKNPDRFITMNQFEKIVFYYVFQTSKSETPNNDIVNEAMLYSDDIYFNLLPIIHDVIKVMADDTDYTNKVLKLRLPTNKNK